MILLSGHGQIHDAMFFLLISLVIQLDQFQFPHLDRFAQGLCSRQRQLRNRHFRVCLYVCLGSIEVPRLRRFCAGLQQLFRWEVVRHHGEEGHGQRWLLLWWWYRCRHSSSAHLRVLEVWEPWARVAENGCLPKSIVIHYGVRARSSCLRDLPEGTARRLRLMQCYSSMWHVSLSHPQLYLHHLNEDFQAVLQTCVYSEFRL